ncbi:phosphopantetheine-binding protein [Kineococcus sp. TBRC 1896]|uniref:Phosphopantetheine-binding protein n=1 Tax=Kineococcus mangrovi TaxID=1660183 RepID=A0ABV4I441_9ACTN
MPAPLTPLTPLTVEAVLSDLASAAGLPREEVAREDPLDDLGVDSIRLMALVDRWRRAGADVSFPRIAAARTVEDVLIVLVPTPSRKA